MGQRSISQQYHKHIEYGENTASQGMVHSSLLMAKGGPDTCNKPLNNNGCVQ